MAGASVLENCLGLSAMVQREEGGNGPQFGVGVLEYSVAGYFDVREG